MLNNVPKHPSIIQISRSIRCAAWFGLLAHGTIALLRSYLFMSRYDGSSHYLLPIAESCCCLVAVFLSFRGSIYGMSFLLLHHLVMKAVFILSLGRSDPIFLTVIVTIVSAMIYADGLAASVRLSRLATKENETLRVL